MFKQNISFEVWGGESGKYRLRDNQGKPLENSPEETCKRVALAIADTEQEDKKNFYYEQFLSILGTKFAGGGRIMANAGAMQYKKETSLINCTVMQQIPDSIAGIMDIAKEAAITLKSGCGVGYDFSSIRPKGSHVFGAGAATSGIISFIKIFNSICSTIMSGGGRRGAQMGCLDISSPEIEDFIIAKNDNDSFGYFNFSILISDDFMNAVLNDLNWDLWFWEKINDKIDSKQICIIKQNDIPYNHKEYQYFSFDKDHCEVVYNNCSVNNLFKKKIFKTVKAKYLFDLITKSTYDYWEPGFLLIDKINSENNLYFCETIRTTNPCGEVPLPSFSSCLLGSMILPAYVKNEFENNVSFDFEQFRKDIKIASRFLDNVVEINNLPIKEMRIEISKKRRHGLGFTGLGSCLNMMCLSYGSEDSLIFANKISYIMAEESLFANIELAKEKGCAKIFDSIESREFLLKSKYLIRLLDAINDDRIRKDIMEYGLRYSHATSIAPTGTLSLTWGNDCSGGIEPVIANTCLRNFREAGKKTKTQKECFDYSFYLWKNKYGDIPIPDYWRTVNDLKIIDHLKMVSIVQNWCDSSISKTINIPADYSFNDFKNVYLDGWKFGLKGITTYRPNNKNSSGILVQKDNLKNTIYNFILENGSEISLNGSSYVEYEGETHNVANLFDALKGGIYGDM